MVNGNEKNIAMTAAKEYLPAFTQGHELVHVLRKVMTSLRWESVAFRFAANSGILQQLWWLAALSRKRASDWCFPGDRRPELLELLVLVRRRARSRGWRALRTCARQGGRGRATARVAGWEASQVPASSNAGAGPPPPRDLWARALLTPRSVGPPASLCLPSAGPDLRPSGKAGKEESWRSARSSETGGDVLCSLWMMVSRSWVDMDVPQLMGCALVIDLLQTQVKVMGFQKWWLL
ncbi:uncharacterized protein LOC117024605 [Rhinolophus ferrumequinum]|uniref:uncharacterized protein LOC117024605 n=1 Tax=Rhinolophus ferrumequinum TaxID=59479 RepID=UPI00140FB641|nr:uncharacterized protein LOC117024605 [Rhinolophus ferrumequinum]